MNGKVARRQRALRRSQENTRLTRKAASVDRSAHEQEFDRLLAELRKDRADALKTANAEYEKTVKKAAKAQFEREQRSSVAVSMTAKGEATVTVKVYDTDDLAGLPARLDVLRAEAVRVYSETARAVRTT